MQKVLDKGEVEIIQHGNDDLTVVNAARVSFAKNKDAIDASDIKLIEYLAKNKHWTPFAQARMTFVVHVDTGAPLIELLRFLFDEERSAGFTLLGQQYSAIYQSMELIVSGSLWGWATAHMPMCEWSKAVVANALLKRAPHAAKALGVEARPAPDHPVGQPYTGHPNAFTFRIKAPIFVLRQLMRSNVGIVYNEVSRRYVDTPPEFYDPEEWRGRPEKGIKQGSGGPVHEQLFCRDAYEVFLRSSEFTYGDLLDANVAPEQARIALPLSMYSEVWMTATLPALRRIMSLRSNLGTSNHAQKEIEEYARAMNRELGNFGHSIEFT